MVFWSTTPARGVKILDGITLAQLFSAKKSLNFGYPMGRLVLVEHYVGKSIVLLFSHYFLFLYPIVFLSCDFFGIFFFPCAGVDSGRALRQKLNSKLPLGNCLTDCWSNHYGYRRYLYHLGNEQTTGGTVNTNLPLPPYHLILQ